MAPVIRLAAVGDLHMRPAVRGRFRPAFTDLPANADLLLLAGDLTNGGTLQEAELLCEEVSSVRIPTVAVLGNHDHDEENGDRIAAMLRRLGVRVLDGDGVTIDVAGTRVGVAGVMGGGGGFPDGSTNHMENGGPADTARLRRGPEDADRLRSALARLHGDVRVALLHFSPVTDTLAGEPREIYPGLGCHELAAAIDSGRVHLAVHGHAHAGSERGLTAGGTPVRNVSHPVLRRPYAVYELMPDLVGRQPS